MARATTPAKPGERSQRSRAAPRDPPAASRSRRQSAGIFLSLIVMLIAALGVMALPICILIVAGALPTVVAVLVDRHPRRYLARTVGAVNVAGVLPGALRVWEAGISFPSLGHVIASPLNWLVMYGAAGLGWLLFFSVPPVVSMFMEMKVEDTTRRLEARAKGLTEEWGEEVTGRKRTS
jgi:hypothetical protein